MRTHSVLSPFWSTACVSAFAVVTAACGSLDDHTGTPTVLATIDGQLSNSKMVAVGNDVRVAVVWLSGNNGYSVAQDLPVQPVFPAKFVIQLDEPPPQAAMFSPKGGPSDYQVAGGFVVAYEDLNGNGMLDLVPNDAGTFVDKIIGANENLGLVYLQGTLPADGGNADSFGKPPSLGYSWYQLSSCQVMAGPQPGGDASVREAGACIPSEWLSITTPYDLEVATDAEVDQLMCTNYGQSGSGSVGESVWYVDMQGTPPGGYPSAGAAGLTCMGTSEYSVSQCTTVHNGLCEQSMNCTGMTVLLGKAATPAGWPCP